MSYKLLLESDEHTTGFIRRIFHLMKQTLVEDNERSAFMQLDLQSNIEATPYLLHFNETCLGKVQGSLQFGRAIALLRSYCAEDEIPHSDGSIG
jgi:hypothetical protein